MSVLLDVLAYNTYYTAFNANMVVNELFLDSATLRDNVIALAKQLGYRPKSKVAPEARVTLQQLILLLLQKYLYYRKEQVSQPYSMIHFIPM